jgi:hypothetical protein
VLDTAQANANYEIGLCQADSADFVLAMYPRADRSTTQFRVLLSGTLEDGDQVAFLIFPSP